ncbi:uncharacterized protein [Parasteatoda tepidariorum]|uniref:uncharacterized protein n=1 Tax=Parasteatoda tepidariorum TaxID=114398 RepID=UPI0039BD177F
MALLRLNKQFGYFIVLCQVGLVYMGAPLPRFNAQRCDALKLDDCFRDLQVFLRLLSLPFTSDVEELDKLCEQSVAGYNCSQVLFENRDCLSAQNKEVLPVFISMAQYTHFMFCGDGQSADKGFMRTALLEESECVLKYKEGMKCCGRESHVANLPVLEVFEEPRKSLTEKQISTCCPLSRYLECVSDTVMECGSGAVNLTNEYIRRAAGEQVQGLCQGLPNYPNPDNITCPESVPVCSGCYTLRLENYSYIFMFAIIGLLQYKYF